MFETHMRDGHIHTKRTSRICVVLLVPPPQHRARLVPFNITDITWQYSMLSDWIVWLTLIPRHIHARTRFHLHTIRKPRSNVFWTLAARDCALARNVQCEWPHQFVTIHDHSRCTLSCEVMNKSWHAPQRKHVWASRRWWRTRSPLMGVFTHFK